MVKKPRSQGVQKAPAEPLKGNRSSKVTSFTLRPETVEKLRRLSLTRKLDGVEPSAQTAILEEALAQYFKKAGV